MFNPYTSPHVHWFPYTLHHCPNLRDSRISTRHLYENFKNRRAFPRLDRRRDLPEWTLLGRPMRPCSVCGLRFEDVGEHRYWITLRVATDTVPLLVNACSQPCVDALPEPPPGYIDHPHRGGRAIVQPTERRPR